MGLAMPISIPRQQEEGKREVAAHPHHPQPGSATRGLWPARSALGVASVAARRPSRYGIDRTIISNGFRRKQWVAIEVSPWCAVKRRVFSVGATPTRQLSLQPVAIGAAVEVTKPSKPSMERVALGDSASRQAAT